MPITQRGSVLTAADAAASANYGAAVSLSADGLLLAIGAPLRLGSFTGQGGVYLYDWSAGAWVARGGVLTAADAAANDRFGTAVALSGNGLVLAVGARWWEGGAADQGGVYLYDWSGSAWVARGSVLTAADAAASDYFGSALALSYDGSVLAVGAPYWEGGAADQGAVYLYDWSSVWTLRGSALTAADAEANDHFGAALALSADGAQMAVGAPQWDSVSGDEGGVYLYDWSGSAWVARGSVLEAADHASNDYFGAAVSLSGDGLALAVGAPQWEGGLANQGGVYLYDWSAGAWVQRGSVLAAADGALGDTFGAAVALSGDGLLLAAGGPLWEGALSNQGGVYLYDESDLLGAASAPTDLSMTASGTPSASTALAVILSVGTPIARTALSMTASGAAEAATELELIASTGAAAALSKLTVTASGTPAAPTRLTLDLALGAAAAAARLTVLAATGSPVASTALTLLASTGAATAPTDLAVTWPVGAASAATALTVSGSGAVTAPTLLAVLAPGHVPNWSARCLIDGVDVSAQLVGQATVTAEEGAARIAQLTLQPPSGVIAPLDYVGKTLHLDYVLLIDGVAVPRRLFTGRIDTPHYDPDTTLLMIDCTDDLQNRVAALPLAVIAATVGGRFSDAVQGETDDHWDYAQARLSTVAASLDAGADGGLRLTPWQSAAVWASWGAADLLYQRMRLTLPQRSTLVNRVDIAFDYRYPRLRQRTTSVGWSGTRADMAKTGYAYPSQQDILGAAGGAGWTATAGVFWPAPAAIPHSSGGFIYPAPGSIDMAVVYLAQRHSQTITEAHALAVTAPESIAANGELAHALRGALESRFDGSAWESALDVEPLISGSGEQDYSPDAPRGSADHALQTLLDQARVKILGSHRSARVGNAVLCNPDLDVDKRVAIATAEVVAEGKVASVVHSLDFDAGSAVSSFELAIFGAGGAGILGPDTLTPPAVSPDDANDAQDWGSAVPPLFTNVYGSTPYQTALMGLLLNPPESISVEDIPDVGSQSFPNPAYVAGSYPVTGFRVAMPGVDDASRNPRALDVAATYAIVIPPDPLTFTIP